MNTIFKFVKKTDPSVYKYLKVYDATSQTGWGNFTCDVLDVSGTAPSNNDEILVEVELAGIAGANGTDGGAGSAGTSGSSGTSGGSGAPGSSGTSGSSGISGSSGTSGTRGSSGSSGTSGTRGSSGSSGTSGTRGSSGSSGISGSSGTSGTSVSTTGTTNRITKFTSATTIGDSNASDNGTIFQIDTVNAKISTSLAVGTINPSGVTGRIDAESDVVAFSTSDIRFKKDIVKISDALQKVKSIGGYEYLWKEETKNIHGFSGKDIGVIAQEIEKIIPEIVSTKESGFKGVRYEKIIPLLIEAIKDLSIQVEELRKNK